MAHPKLFNVVVAPGVVVDCFGLLARITAHLWPLTSVSAGS